MGRGKTGSGQRLSLKGTEYPGDREGQQNNRDTPRRLDLEDMKERRISTVAYLFPCTEWPVGSQGVPAGVGI